VQALGPVKQTFANGFESHHRLGRVRLEP
jgi:hypothetical protein